MSDKYDNFHRLTDLLNAPDTPMRQKEFSDRMGLLYSAVEQSTIQEIDGGGNLVNGDPKNALSLLKKCFHEFGEISSSDDEHEWEQRWFKYNNPLCLFGWSDESLPDFRILKPSLIKTRTINKFRHNLMDVTIDKILKVEPDIDCNTAFLKLKEMALDGHSPFTGLIKGDALIYTGTNNKLKPFTIGALRKRLSRKRQ